MTNDKLLLFRDRLRAVDVLVLDLAFFGVELGQKLLGGCYIVPAAVLEVDDGLAVEVDRDDAADHTVEAGQLLAICLDGDILIGPLTLESGVEIHIAIRIKVG